MLDLMYVLIELPLDSIKAIAIVTLIMAILIRDPDAAIKNATKIAIVLSIAHKLLGLI